MPQYKIVSDWSPRGGFEGRTVRRGDVVELEPGDVLVKAGVALLLPSVPEAPAEEEPGEPAPSPTRKKR